MAPNKQRLTKTGQPLKGVPNAMTPESIISNGDGNIGDKSGRAARHQSSRLDTYSMELHKNKIAATKRQETIKRKQAQKEVEDEEEEENIPPPPKKKRARHIEESDEEDNLHLDKNMQQDINELSEREDQPNISGSMFNEMTFSSSGPTRFDQPHRSSTANDQRRALQKITNQSDIDLQRRAGDNVPAVNKTISVPQAVSSSSPASSPSTRTDAVQLLHRQFPGRVSSQHNTGGSQTNIQKTPHHSPFSNSLNSTIPTQQLQTQSQPHIYPSASQARPQAQLQSRATPLAPQAQPQTQLQPRTTPLAPQAQPQTQSQSNACPSGPQTIRQSQPLVSQTRRQPSVTQTTTRRTQVCNSSPTATREDEATSGDSATRVQLRSDPYAPAKRRHWRMKDFESGTNSLLINACKYYRVLIVTENPWPTRLEGEELASESWQLACQDYETETTALTETYDVIRQRGSQVRGEIITKVRPLVEVHYCFDPSEHKHEQLATGAYVESLLCRNAFVYRDHENRKGLYENPLILKAIRTQWFKDCNSEGPTFHVYFNPIPLPTIALILTAIEVCIKEWSTGVLLPKKFTEKEFKAAYLEHLLTLEKWQAHSQGRFLLPRLQQKLHDEARVGARAGPIQTDTVARLDNADFDAAAEDAATNSSEDSSFDDTLCRDDNGGEDGDENGGNGRNGGDLGDEYGLGDDGRPGYEQNEIDQGDNNTDHMVDDENETDEAA